MNDIKQYLPPIYDGIIEVDAYIEGENRLFEQLDSETRKAKNNLFVATSDLDGIAEYEKLLGIIPKPAVEDLEFRRARVINRLSSVPPFSFRFLQSRLDEIIGAGKYQTYIDYSTYTLYIESSAENQNWYHEILVTLNKIKPVNIVFRNKPLLHEEIRVGESINMVEGIFNYRLGTTWILGANAFLSYNDKGVIKMASNPSIEANLLNRMASFTADDINSVRINGEIIITNLLGKSAQNNSAIVEYEVSRDLGITEITRIELLDINGMTLSNSVVYLPILENIILKHNILIKEGV